MTKDVCRNCGNDKFWFSKNNLDKRCKNCGEIQ